MGFIQGGPSRKEKIGRVFGNALQNIGEQVQSSMLQQQKLQMQQQELDMQKQQHEYTVNSLRYMQTTKLLSDAAENNPDLYKAYVNDEKFMTQYKTAADKAQLPMPDVGLLAKAPEAFRKSSQSLQQIYYGIMTSGGSQTAIKKAQKDFSSFLSDPANGIFTAKNPEYVQKTIQTLNEQEEKAKEDASFASAASGGNLTGPALKKFGAAGVQLEAQPAAGGGFKLQPQPEPGIRIKISNQDIKPLTDMDELIAKSNRLLELADKPENSGMFGLTGGTARANIPVVGKLQRNAMSSDQLELYQKTKQLRTDYEKAQGGVREVANVQMQKAIAENIPQGTLTKKQFKSSMQTFNAMNKMLKAQKTASLIKSKAGQDPDKQQELFDRLSLEPDVYQMTRKIINGEKLSPDDLQSSSSGMVKVQLSDGRTGSIPQDKVESFLKANPGSKQVE